METEIQNNDHATTTVIDTAVETVQPAAESKESTRQASKPVAVKRDFVRVGNIDRSVKRRLAVNNGRSQKVSRVSKQVPIIISGYIEKAMTHFIQKLDVVRKNLKRTHMTLDCVRQAAKATPEAHVYRKLCFIGDSARYQFGPNNCIP